MPPSDFRLRDESLDPGVRLLAVEGEIDVATAAALEERLNAAIDGGEVAIVVDLEATSFIDSTGLWVLLNAVRRLIRARGALAVACSNRTCLRMFDLTQTRDTLNVVASREEALALVRCEQASA